MADDSLFVGGEDKNSEASETSKTKLLNLGDGDFLDSVEDAANDIGNSITDLFKGKGKRNSTDNKDFKIRERSIANRHRTAIGNIVNDVFSGNLFDAGVGAVNLFNTGTKWSTYLDQYVDKDAYSFKYHYYYDPSSNDNGGDNGDNTEAMSVVNKLTFLEMLEDPTILGYSAKIDFDESPLFRDGNNSGNDNTEVSQPSINSCIGFINDYKDKKYSELNFADSYLREFKEGMQKIFSAPETLNAQLYKDPLQKNHYINSIEGLEKLDNHFVDFGNEDINISGQRTLTEHLIITLQEDVRLFTNRLAFLYRNLSWSYNMGKKLIPENLLRFNLYIKVADYRNFTRDTSSDVEGGIRDSIRNDYSRVIYELKDCEFYFDSSLNPNNLAMAGFEEVNRALSQLKFKIKYRKVNRIFYSTFFDGDLRKFLIGDKFHDPNTDRIYGDLISMGYSDTKKRKATTNNIAVVPTLGQRIDKLKNNGLFSEDDNDTALGRFTKSVGNEAAKAGFEVVDEGLQKVKQKANDTQPFGGNLRDNLLSNVTSKTSDLGDLHPDLDNFVIAPNRDLHPSVNQNIEDPVDDLHPDLDQRINVPTLTDVHPELNQQIEEPVKDVHPELDQAIEVPTLTDVHPELNQVIEEPAADLHPELNQAIEHPDEDLHPELGNVVENPVEDLHPELGNVVENPSEDLHPELNQATEEPNEDLHPESNQAIEEPNGDVHQELGDVVENPKEDLHPELNQTTEEPNGDLHDNVNSVIENPKENLHPELNQTTEEPSEDLHNDVDNVVEEPSEDLHDSVDSVIKEPNEDLHDNKDSTVKNPNEDLHDSDFRKFIKDPEQYNPLDKPKFKDTEE